MQDQIHIPQDASISVEIKEVSNKVIRYFREFLESDFRRVQAPRRRIQLKTQAGFRSSIDLRKYPVFFNDVWALAEKSSQEMTLPIKRRKYKAEVSPVLRNLVQQYVEKLDDVVFGQIRGELVKHAQSIRAKFATNPDLFTDSVSADLHERAAKAVVRPLLALFDGAFKEIAQNEQESIFEFEAELTQALCEASVPHLTSALNTLLLQGDEAALNATLAEFFCAQAAQPILTEFFEAYAASDAFQELRDVLNYAQSDDTLTTYLYFCSIRFGAHDYPLFFMPAQLRLRAEDSGYDLVVEPKLYINKQAIEFIVAEMRQGAEQVATAVIPDRIIHLAQASQSGSLDTAKMRMTHVLRDLERSFDVASKIDLSQTRQQTARSSELRLTNSIHIAVCDRSDESLVSDYEALLSSIDPDHQAAGDLFANLVNEMLFKEPQSVSESVRQEWNGLSTERRLVPDSPIPLNEEQIRIDIARRKGARFIAVEGPPGTGKSHTITALAFNAIMDHQSVLIVSDKNEALDVVQNKLTQTLQSIRTGEDFPNPILRLGKDGTYRSLISGASRVKIENHHKAQSANMPGLEIELLAKSKSLRDRIETSVRELSRVRMSELAQVHLLEEKIKLVFENGADMVSALDFVSHELTPGISAVHKAFSINERFNRTFIEANFSSPKTLLSLHSNLRFTDACYEVSKHIKKEQLSAMALFESVQASQLNELMAFCLKIKSLKKPLLGFLFQGNALASIELEISKRFKCVNPVGIARRSKELMVVVSVLGIIAKESRDAGVPDGHTDELYGALLKGSKGHAGARAANRLAESLVEFFSETNNDVLKNAFSHVRSGSLIEAIYLLGEYLMSIESARMAFRRVPNINFVEEKSQIEAMHTARLAHQLDSRFLNFVEKQRATAQTLSGVIKSRAQFPTDQFKSLREAFPCCIAGIRELAEFVPLKTEVFDLVIIDEGSQVSVAQAIPAMLRAKQVIVFGDRRQFANVKSHNASNAANASYMSDLKEHFRQNISTAVDKLDRLQRFDVKRSVLEFVEMVAGHTELLRKHFRGYPELIGYSSRHFYGGALQAIKVRAKPIEDVLQFVVVEPSAKSTSGTSGAKDGRRNTNPAEAQHIIGMLEDYLTKEKPPSVGVITPFTEQAAYLSALVSRHAMSDRFDSELHLKIMTADSCQGEERDVIVYSLVATRERDVLNYIFPVELKADDDENDSLKAQRLNVAFSRAKECMVFVLSKQPNEFSGCIGQALMHYHRVLHERKVASVEDTDQSSPMEAKLLMWLTNTRFMQLHADSVELTAQFPVGDYLKQLDPLYEHPSYKVDFLLKYRNGEKSTNVVIEYDGLEYHFTNPKNVTAANFESYQKPEDVERQFVLESYGYRFLRVNRFNIGKDPVARLDERLNELISVDRKDKPEISFSKKQAPLDLIREQAKSLQNGHSKTCAKCSEIKIRDDFFDVSLAGGKGGHGRICRSCKKIN